MKRWIFIGLVVLSTTQLQLQFTYTPLLQVLLSTLQNIWMLAHSAAFPVN